MIDSILYHYYRLDRQVFIMKAECCISAGLSDNAMAAAYGEQHKDPEHEAAVSDMGRFKDLEHVE